MLVVSCSCCRVALALVVMAVGSGCAAQARAYPVGTTEVYSGPVIRAYDYPHTYFQGRLVYWYGDRWIYRDGDRWNYYRTEPPELYRFRTTIQQAPPAARYVPSWGDRQEPVRPLPPSPSPVPSSPPPGERIR
jgi:hypothetical protein